MIDNQSISSMTEYGFLSLLVSIVKLKWNNPIIEKDKLEKDLYDFYDNIDFHFLFENVLKRENIDGINYINLNDSFQIAQSLGILSREQYSSKNKKYIINITKEEALKNLTNFSYIQINAMQKLICKINENEKQEKVRLVSFFQLEKEEELFAKYAKENLNSKTRLSWDEQEIKETPRARLTPIFSSKKEEELFAKYARENLNSKTRLSWDEQEKDRTLTKK